MEANSVSALQDIINLKALDRLKKDLEDLSKRTQDTYSLLSNIRIDIVVPEEYKDINNKEEPVIKTILLARIFDYLDEYIRKQRIGEYIEEESRSFVQEIKELRERINELENIIPNDGSNE